MKKILFALAWMASALTASAQKGYTLTGTADGTVDGDTVYLCDMQGFFAMVPEDSTIIKNGKFQFKGTTDAAKFRYVMPVHNGQSTDMVAVIMENVDIQVHSFGNSSQKPGEVKGGPATDLYLKYINDDPFMKQLNDNWAIIQDSTRNENDRTAAQTQNDELEKQEKKWQKEFVLSHIPSTFSDLMLIYQVWPEEDLEEILGKMKGASVQYANYKAIMAERAAQEATQVGKTYTDIALQNPQGKTIKVSEYVKKNKYTLLDFWASWCGPCRGEMPNVVKAYNRYHSKGFEVVGVSLDNNKNAWTKAIKQLNMPWPQMSDLKGWGSVGAAAYNVKAIPANVLIDKNGKIVAKDLREEDLQNKLAELFK